MSEGAERVPERVPFREVPEQVPGRFWGGARADSREVWGAVSAAGCWNGSGNVPVLAHSSRSGMRYDVANLASASPRFWEIFPGMGNSARFQALACNLLPLRYIRPSWT